MKFNDIAEKLPGTWSIGKVFNVYQDQEVSSCYLIRSDGLKIWSEIDHKGKILFSWSRPQYKGGWFDIRNNDNVSVKDPSILVSINKSAETIAKDLVKRLLPDAERLQEIANEKISSWTESANLTRQAVQAIANSACVPGPRKYDFQKKTSVPDHDGTEVDLYPAWTAGTGCGKAKVNNGGRDVDFELKSIPTDKAREIACFLRRRIFNGGEVKVIHSKKKAIIKIEDSSTSVIDV